MHDFGNFTLKGLHGVFKKERFYKPGASEKERIFLCESGIGCDPTPNTRRTIRGKWVSDGSSDTVDSYSFEAILKDGEKIKAPITSFAEEGAGDIKKKKVEDEPEVVVEDKVVPQKKVRRKR